MRLDLRYLGSSALRSVPGGGSALAFAPNLARPKVFFDADLLFPLRFREAMSALHDVVVGDLRHKKRDKSAYQAWKQQQSLESQTLRQRLVKEATEDELERLKAEPIPGDLDEQFRSAHQRYWRERVRWANELSRNDPDLFRALVPCDPVVTVAPDVVFFECFAKDESAYGCLSVARDAFGAQAAADAGLGTTNVDYSMALYDHFQSLRSYRKTRLLVDPGGFEVKIEGNPDLREEKIDLPPSWLRGFGQLQAAMALPARRVELSVDVVYSILAHLKRHREKTGPRSLVFRLTPGKPPVVVIEPWGLTLTSRGRAYDGPRPEEIKVWGRRRLFALARTLPLAEGVDVRLFGSGMPSIWTARLGEMRFTLGLSGWTANDWTSGSNLDAHLAELVADATVVENVSQRLLAARLATRGQLAAQTSASEGAVQAALVALAKRGQLVFDFAGDVVRWRPIMPVALSEAVLGPEPPELVEGRRLAGSVTVSGRGALANGTLLTAEVGKRPCELLLDADGAIRRAKCDCSHFYTSGLRRGPCRHLIALRLWAIANGVVGSTIAPESLSRAGGAVAAAPSVTMAAASTPSPVASSITTSNTATSGTANAGALIQLHYFSAPCLAFLEAEAKRRGQPLDEVVTQAWKIAKKEIAERTSAPPLRPAEELVAKTLELPRALGDEISAEEERLALPAPRGRLLGWACVQVEGSLKLTGSLFKKT